MVPLLVLRMEEVESTVVARELPHSTVNSVQVVLVLGPAGEADPAPRVVALGLLVKRTLGLHVLTHRVRVQELRPTGGAHSILKQNRRSGRFS